MGKLQGKRVDRYFGKELREAVYAELEREADEWCQGAWGPFDGPPVSAFGRYSQAAYWKRDRTWRQVITRLWEGAPLDLSLSELRRFHQLRGALVTALDNARADEKLWSKLTDECSALNAVAFEAPIKKILTDDQAAGLKARVKKFDRIGDGPLWRRERDALGFLIDAYEPPPNRVIAIMAIMSGYVSPRWPESAAAGPIPVSKAIEYVVDAVRTLRRKAAKQDDLAG